MEFLTNSTGEVSKPSIFEIAAQTTLSQLLKPAAHYLLDIFAAKWPNRIGTVEQCFDEIYAVLSALIESYFLLKFNASFSEHFYGLVRSGDFTLIKKALSLVFLVVFPYLTGKIEQRLNARLPSNDILRIVEKWNILSRLKSLFSLVRLVYYFRYAYSPDHPYYHPVFHLMGIKLQRTVSSSSSSSLLSQLLPTVLFVIQCVDHYQNTTQVDRKLSIPPPKRHPTIWENVKARDASNNSDMSLNAENQENIKPGKCPICHNDIDRAAAIPTGYIFCAACIKQHLSTSSLCPVTMQPVDHVRLLLKGA